MMVNEIRIAILEDLREVAEHLKDIIHQETDMTCTQVYFNAEDAIHFLPQQPVDILIVDIGLPRASGIEAIQALTNTCPATQYCMFTVYEDDDKIFQSLQAGAKGYILKGTPGDKIVESIRELYRGGSPMTPNIARRVLDIFQTLQQAPVAASLPVTPREEEILQLLAKGLLYKEIADTLGITVGTVKQHIHKIYDKLQVTNRTEAINKFNDSGPPK